MCIRDRSYGAYRKTGMKKKKTKVSDIQSVIMLALSLMTVTTSIFIGLLVYNLSLIHISVTE